MKRGFILIILIVFIIAISNLVFSISPPPCETGYASNTFCGSEHTVDRHYQQLSGNNCINSVQLIQDCALTNQICIGSTDIYGSGAYCGNKTGCANECYTGQNICTGYGGYVNRYVATCGNYDSDPCLEYQVSQPFYKDCGSAYSCMNGECISPCTNGAINPPNCNSCTEVFVLQNNQCVPKYCDDVSFEIKEVCYDKKAEQIAKTIKISLYNNGSRNLFDGFLIVELVEGSVNVHQFTPDRYLKPEEYYTNDEMGSALPGKYNVTGRWNFDFSRISKIFLSFDGCMKKNIEKITDCDTKEVLYTTPKQQNSLTEQTSEQNIENQTINKESKTSMGKYIVIILIVVGIIILGLFLRKRISKIPKKPKEIKELKETKKEFEEKERISSDIENAISVSNFSVKHGNKIVLENVNFKIKRGTFVSLIGPAGTGKSTIIESIVGRKKPDSGKIMIFDKNINDKSIFQHVGFVPQSPEIYMNQTVIHNLITSGTKWGIKDTKEKSEKIINKLNLSNRKDVTANKLSGGQIKLLSLAMELIRDPELLVLDEPTTGLDPNTRNQIITILSSLTGYDHKTVLITTHFMDDAEECDEVILIGNKKILAQGSPSKLEKMLPGGGKVVNIILDNVTDDLLRKIEKIEGIENIIREGREINILTNDPNPIKIGNKITEIGGVVNETKLTKSTMKEVFVYFTGANPEEK